MELTKSSANPKPKVQMDSYQTVDVQNRMGEKRGFQWLMNASEQELLLNKKQAVELANTTSSGDTVNLNDYLWCKNSTAPTSDNRSSRDLVEINFLENFGKDGSTRSSMSESQTVLLEPIQRTEGIKLSVPASDNVYDSFTRPFSLGWTQNKMPLYEQAFNRSSSSVRPTAHTYRNGFKPFAAVNNHYNRTTGAIPFNGLVRPQPSENVVPSGHVVNNAERSNAAQGGSVPVNGSRPLDSSALSLIRSQAGANVVPSGHVVNNAERSNAALGGSVPVNGSRPLDSSALSLIHSQPGANVVPSGHVVNNAERSNAALGGSVPVNDGSRHLDSSALSLIRSQPGANAVPLGHVVNNAERSKAALGGSVPFNGSRPLQSSGLSLNRSQLGANVVPLGNVNNNVRSMVAFGGFNSNNHREIGPSSSRVISNNYANQPSEGMMVWRDVIGQARRTYEATLASGAVGIVQKNEEEKKNCQTRISNFPEDVKSLLSTGILDGVPVKYVPWPRKKKNILEGVIRGPGIMCGCEKCGFSKCYTPYELEIHAGYDSKHPNNNVFVPNGESLYAVVQVLKATPRNQLFEAIKTVTGSTINQKNFLKWKASFLAEMAKGLGVASRS